MRENLYIYWSVVMMVFTILLASLFDPVASASGSFVLAFDVGRIADMVFSPYTLTCVAVLIAGIVYANRTWAGSAEFTATDKMVTIWFLANVCWYHTGCDMLSGLFQVMPNLRDAYITSNAAHLQPMHHPERIYLDMVYWLEVCIQVPLCIAVYFMYLKRSPHRPATEIFLCALHLAGTIAYYLPPLLMGETSHPIMSNLDRSIASLWIIIPVLLSVRASRQIAARWSAS